MNRGYWVKIISKTKKGLVNGTTDKQTREFQDELYDRILGV